MIVFYDPTTDHALLNLRYDELALGPDKLGFVVEVALLAEVGMIQPAELSEGERRRFVTERLARCTLHVPDQRSVARRAERAGAPAPRSAQRRVEAAADPSRRYLGPGAARRREGDAQRHREDLADPGPARGRDAPRAPRGRFSQVRAADLAAPARRGAELARGHRRRARSAERRLLDTEIADLPPLPPRGLARAQSPQLPLGFEPASTIYARYLRSGKWLPIRIGSLSLKGAALMTGALPRLHDHVDVALVVRRRTAHSSAARSARCRRCARQPSTGASTFSVSFELDQASRRQLTALLTAARAAKVTIKPPPPRATRRFVVEWPVCLGTMRGAMKADALDVSLTGLFVRPVLALTVDTTCNFSVVLDDGGGPVAGRAKVVRQLLESEAAACGLAPGFGLSILDMGDIDKRAVGHVHRSGSRSAPRSACWSAPRRSGSPSFRPRSPRRATRSWAAPIRARSSSSRARTPARWMRRSIDAHWLGDGASASWVESLFSARDVPCVTVSGDVRRARTTVDRLLEVVR